MAISDTSYVTALPATKEAALSRGPSSVNDEVIALFDELRTPLLRYLFSFSIPVPDAEEIVQEVFLALFRHLREGKSRANLHGWIFCVAHYSALKHRIRSRQHADRFTNDPDLSLSAVDDEPRVDVKLEESERRGRLLAVVRALPKQDRNCLSLRAEGLRYREIADILGIALGSVANSLSKSISRLRRVEES